MDDPVLPFDLARIFWGDQPVLFYLAIAARTLIICFSTLVLLRWIGSRTISQLSTVAFLLVIALGSAVGDATFYPDVPILHALLVVTAVVLINKLLNQLIYRFHFAMRLVDDEPVEVLPHGVFTREGLSLRNLAIAELRARLRLQGVINLGELAQAYMEPGGRVSVFRLKDQRAGLSLVPLSPMPSDPHAEGSGRKRRHPASPILASPLYRASSCSGDDHRATARDSLRINGCVFPSRSPSTLSSSR